MSWVDIKNADLVVGETYSIRAERTPQNQKIFPSMGKGKGKYVIDCVRLKGKYAIFGHGYPRGEWSRHWELDFELLKEMRDGSYITSTQRRLWPWIGEPPIGRMNTRWSIGIEIKPTICDLNIVSTLIQSRFRGNQSRLKSKAKGRITKKQLESDWLSLREMMEESGLNSEEIEKFHRDHYGGKKKLTEKKYKKLIEQKKKGKLSKKNKKILDRTLKKKLCKCIKGVRYSNKWSNKRSNNKRSNKGSEYPICLSSIYTKRGFKPPKRAIKGCKNN